LSSASMLAAATIRLQYGSETKTNWLSSRQIKKNGPGQSCRLALAMLPGFIRI
jgi:hypothetical protein